MNRSAFLDRLAIGLFIFGLLAGSFGYGVLVGVYKLFPHGPLRDAKAAIEALYEKYTISAQPFTAVVDHDKAGVTIYDPERAFDGYTFLLLNRNGTYQAELINMRGDTLHQWHFRFSQVWPDAPHIDERAGDERMYWHGAHLYPNGDILFNIGGGTFPYGAGLVKLDKESKVLWALPRNTHHDLHVDENGIIYAAAHNFRKDGLRELPYLEPPYYEDTILKVSPQGDVLDEISMLKALANSEYAGLLSLTYREDLQVSSKDPLHLNTVEVIRSALAEESPIFRTGDLLVSFRNLNTIAIVDPTVKVVRCALTGMFVRQHDPDLLRNGNILLFDNVDANEDYDRSQILEINPIWQRIVWRYQGSADGPLFSRERANQQPLPNGNILIAETDGGRVLEVTRDQASKVVWEYYNPVQSSEGEKKVGWISLALRFKPEDLIFVR
jgi:hypothetical protein